MTQDELPQIKQLIDQVKGLTEKTDALDRKFDNFLDHMVGTLDKPGTVRLVERVCRDMYEGPDSVMETTKTFKSDRRLIFGAVAAISMIGPILTAVIKHFFSAP